MVSLDRVTESFSSSDNDRFINHYSEIGRSFPSRLHPHFSSLFDDDFSVRDIKEDMKIGSSFLDSAFPFYSGIRPGRYKSYDLSSPLLHVVTSDISEAPQASGNVRVIPIKVEQRPEKYQDQKGTFHLLNGPLNHTATAGNDSLLDPGHGFGEFDDIASLALPAWMTSSSPQGNNKYVSSDTADPQLKSPKSNEHFNAKADIDDSSLFDSRQRVPLSSIQRVPLSSIQRVPLSSIQRNSYGGKPENWTTIPVKHLDSSPSSVSDEELDSNNNSSPRRYSSARRSRTSSKVKYSRESSNESDNQSHSNSSKKIKRCPICGCCEEHNSINEEANDITSAIEVDLDLPVIEDDEIVSPPQRQVYHDLKVKLSQEDRKIDFIEGDGNCLFRALSKGLYGREKYHKEIRMFIVNLIGTNTSKFAQFVDDEDVEEHINRMRKDGYWATTCEIYAAATLLQRDIFMLTPDHTKKKYSWLLFQPVFEINEALRVSKPHPCYITLCNTNGNHYDRIVPDHGGCNCFLPHPELDGLSPNSSSSVDSNSAA